MFMIAMFGSENIVKTFSGQYTCYTFNTHLFMYLQSNLTYKLNMAPINYLNSVQQLCKCCYFAQT